MSPSPYNQLFAYFGIYLLFMLGFLILLCLICAIVIFCYQRKHPQINSCGEIKETTPIRRTNANEF